MGGKYSECRFGPSSRRRSDIADEALYPKMEGTTIVVEEKSDVVLLRGKPVELLELGKVIDESDRKPVKK